MLNFVLALSLSLIWTATSTASPETDARAAELYASLTCNCPASGKCNCGPACDCVGGIQQISLTQTSYRQPVGHTHTCANCGTTWDHLKNPSHTCQNCGIAQYMQDTRAKAITVNQLAYAPSGGGCANGQCGTPTSTQSYSTVQYGGGCANGQCGTPTRSYGTTYSSSSYSSSTSSSSGGQCGLFKRQPIRN